jgi:hypothetical protein
MQMQYSTRRLFDVLEIGSGTSTNRINDMRQKKALKELQKQQYRQYKTYELTFAQSLGVNLKSPMEWVHLVPVAVKSLYQLPDGYEVCIGSDEYENLPYFFDNISDSSYWHHPFEAQIKAELSRIITAENIVAVEPHQEIDINSQTGLSTDGIPEEGPYKLFEAIFALNYGVDPSLEGHQKYLMPIILETLYDLPEGYRLYLGENEHENFPFFYHAETKVSHWIHPHEEEIKRALKDASKKYGLMLLQLAEIEKLAEDYNDTAKSSKLSTPRDAVSAMVSDAKDRIRRVSTAGLSVDVNRPLTGVMSTKEVVTRSSPSHADIKEILTSDQSVPMPVEMYSRPSTSNTSEQPRSQAHIAKSPINGTSSPNHMNKLPPRHFADVKVSPVNRAVNKDTGKKSEESAPAPVPNLPLHTESATRSGKLTRSASRGQRGLTKLVVDPNGNQIPITVFTPMSLRSGSSFSSFVSYGSDESYSTYDDTSTGYNTGRDSEFTGGPISTRSRIKSSRYFSEPASPMTYRDNESTSPVSPSRGSNKFKHGSGKHSRNDNGIASILSPKTRAMGLGGKPSPLSLCTLNVLIEAKPCR